MGIFHGDLNMKFLYVLLFVAPSCLGFLAHIQKIRDHISAKLKKPECHVEWEDVTTPHCETYDEQVCVEEFQNQCHTEFSTSCQTEFNTQCKTEYQEECQDIPREACHTESSQECSTEYSEVCE